MRLQRQIFDGAKGPDAAQKMRRLVPVQSGLSAAVDHRLVQNLNADARALRQYHLGAIGLGSIVQQLKDDIGIDKLNAHARRRG